MAKTHDANLTGDAAVECHVWACEIAAAERKGDGHPAIRAGRGRAAANNVATERRSIVSENAYRDARTYDRTSHARVRETTLTYTTSPLCQRALRGNVQPNAEKLSMTRTSRGIGILDWQMSVPAPHARDDDGSEPVGTCMPATNPTHSVSGTRTHIVAMSQWDPVARSVK